MKKRGSLGLMIVLILIGIFVGIIGGTFLKYEIGLRKNGLKIEAFIVGWEESYSDIEDSMGHQRKETSYYPVLSFQIEGEKIIKTSNVGMDYETYQQYEIGDMMTVRWSEHDDYLSWSGSISGIIIPSIVLSAGILCMLIGIICYRPR